MKKKKIYNNVESDFSYSKNDLKSNLVVLCMVKTVAQFPNIKKTQRNIQNPGKHLRWNFLRKSLTTFRTRSNVWDGAKIVNGFPRHLTEF